MDGKEQQFWQFRENLVFDVDRGFNLSMSGFWRILYCPVRTIGLSFCASITLTPKMFIFTFLAGQECASARWECMGTSVTTVSQASRTSAKWGANLANAIIIVATATHSQVSHPHAHNISSKITYSWTSVSRLSNHVNYLISHLDGAFIQVHLLLQR